MEITRSLIQTVTMSFEPRQWHMQDLRLGRHQTATSGMVGRSNNKINIIHL